jgi:putative SOS response-associated peptidase YedK
MCGRFIRTNPRAVLVDQFGVAQFVNVDLRPRYNVAPSQIVEAIIGNGAEGRGGSVR